ncbi:hypothetical protein LXL04_018894 [Taraxacum kok-saghyz]
MDSHFPPLEMQSLLIIEVKVAQNKRKESWLLKKEAERGCCWLCWMLLAVLIANFEGNILVERFNGVPGEERLHWRSFLVKLGADNLKGVKNEELFVACHKSVYIVYTVLGHVSIYLVGKDEYDELALSEAIFVVTSAIKDVCGKPPTERLFLDKYGRICLCLDEIVWKGLLENMDKDRIKRLMRLKPPTEF